VGVLPPTTTPHLPRNTAGAQLPPREEFHDKIPP